MKGGSRGAWLAAASAVCYGALGVLAKLAYAEGWNVPSLLTFRFLLAALVVLPLAIRVRGSWTGGLGAFLVGAVGYAGTTALYFPSIRLLTPALSAFLLYLAPPIVAILAWLFFRERLGRRSLVGMALALAGLALITGGAARGDASWPGIALGAASGVVFAGTVLASRHLVGDLAWPRTTLLVSLGAFTSYVVFATATGAFEVPRSVPGYAYVLGIGVLATGVALSLFMAALSLIGASRTAVISTLEPVSTLVLGAIVLADAPGVLGIAGGMLIVAAAALVASDGGDEAGPSPH